MSGLIPAHAGKTKSWWSFQCLLRAHPRSRGENWGSRVPASRARGSSPLTRGKPHAPRRLDPVLGLIPAHAGKTPTPVESAAAGSAHPRSRGENLPLGGRGLRGEGSSPLTRGKHSAARNPGRHWGLIPAHAGKTARRARTRARPRAHPRSRGENEMSAQLSAFAAGSSPLTRGKQSAPTWQAVSTGLIPAHAGKTARCPSRPFRGRAHPRSRGENLAFVVPIVLVGGSSPLTRGKHGLVQAGNGQGGLIPAHAGKTRPVTKRAAPSRAHPRSRGENRCLPEGVTLHQGSSPLTRGKRRSEDIQRDADGLIPAHAGKTGTRSLGSMGVGAHPRSRGENLAVWDNVLYPLGSSPLTRGKLPDSHAQKRLDGLIPAHAGKTSQSLLHPFLTPAHPRSRGENVPPGPRRVGVEGSSPLTRGKLGHYKVPSLRWVAHPRSRGENLR